MLAELVIASLGRSIGGHRPGKDSELARYAAERVVLRTKDVRQANQVAKPCDSREELDRFEGGA